jgi:hypothetical protein
VRPVRAPPDRQTALEKLVDLGACESERARTTDVLCRGWLLPLRRAVDSYNPKQGLLFLDL